MKIIKDKKVKKKSLSFFAFFSLFLSGIHLSSSLFANPINPVVISGNASFSEVQNALEVITSSDRTIINWHDFSIGVNEITTFIQPGAASAVLNRVISDHPSQIFGVLNSNGNVFLINQNGIFFGAEGSVNVGGLVASTLDVSNAEFLAGGDMLFSGDSAAAIENFGLIQANAAGVFLLGRHIINQKDIVTITSNAVLGAGSSILLKTNEHKILINPDLKSLSEGIGIDNSGNILSNQTEIRADGNLYTLAIRHTGEISAIATTEQSGEIYLVAESGTATIEDHAVLAASGFDHSGGTIHILGETVNILDQATITTKNEHCGGTILIGGSFGGRDPNILNANHTTVAAGVAIDSSARLSGAPGNVSIFALETADFNGHISARGGLFSGNGGTVEISGIGNLIFKGTVDTRAYRGEDGLLILDPTDITISGAATANGAFDGGSPLNTFSGTAAAATLNSGDLNTALQTNNVLVTTASAFGSAGNITIGAATTLTLSSSHTLTLLADNNITVTSPLSMTDLDAGTSVLNLTAGNTVTLTNSVSCVNLASLNITTTTGDILLDNAINVTGVPVVLNSGNDVISQGAGTNSIDANQCTITAANDFTVNNDIVFTGGGAASVMTCSAGNAITLADTLTFINWDTATLTSAVGDIVLDNNVTATNINTITFNSANDIINQGATNLFNDTVTHATDLNFNADRDFVVNSQIDINNFNSCAITAGRDFIANNTFAPDNTLTLTVDAGTDITITNAASNVDANNMTLLSFAATNNFTASEPIAMSNVDDTTVTVGNDITVLEAFLSNTTGNITMTAGNDINVGPSDTVSQIGTTSGTVTLTTGRDLNVTGGATTNDRAQIGFSGTAVTSDIDLTVGRNINVTAGSNSNNVALIGHGFATAGTYSGDIIINSVGGNVTLTGDTGATGTVKFAQIGHTRFSGAAVSTFTGDIRGSTPGSPALISGTLSLVGGADTTDFALFGHGGRDSNAIDTYSGEIRVQANAIILTGGTSTDCNASIGFYAVAQVAGVNPIVVAAPSSVQVISATTITMTGNSDGIVSIGARALNSATHPALLTLDLVSVQTGGDLTMTSGTGTETDATIGAFAEVGTAETALTMTIGGNLLINAGTGASARIINGTATAAAKNSTIQVAGDITPTVAGAFTAFIEGETGNLSVTAGGTITLPNLTHIENLGGSNGTLSVTGGTILVQGGGFIRNSGAGSTSFTTTTADLSVSSASFITSIGNVTGTVATNLNLLDNVSIRSTGGTVNISAGNDIQISGTAAGSAFIDSSGSGTYLAGRDITLSGPSAVNEGYIENTSGTLQVTSGRDLSVGNFGRIENLGAGSLTLVVDNQNPSAPSIGDGAFELSSLGSVGRLGGGPLRIFTAIRSQNSIAGTSNLNGTTFTPGTLFVDSATEQWDTYFPSSFGGTPFTIFYKDGAAVPPPPLPTVADILALNPNAFIPFYELFYILSENRIDPVVAWLYEFTVINNLCEKREEKKEFCSSPVLPIKRLPPFIPKLSIRPKYQ